MNSQNELRRESESLQLSIEEKSKQVGDLPNDLLEESDEAGFVVEVNQAANEAGLKIENFIRGSNEKLATCYCMTIELQCTGSYQQICQFFAAVTDLSRVVQFNSIVINHGTESYSLAVELAVYSGFDLNQKKLASTKKVKEAEAKNDAAIQDLSSTGSFATQVSHIKSISTYTQSEVGQ